MRAQRRLELKRIAQAALQATVPNEPPGYVPAVMLPAHEVLDLLYQMPTEPPPAVLRLRRECDGPSGIGRSRVEVGREDLQAMLRLFPRAGTEDVPARPAARWPENQAAYPEFPALLRQAAEALGLCPERSSWADCLGLMKARRGKVPTNGPPESGDRGVALRNLDTENLPRFPEGPARISKWLPPDRESKFWTRRWLVPTSQPVVAAEQVDGQIVIFSPWGTSRSPDRPAAQAFLEALYPGCFDTPKEAE